MTQIITHLEPDILECEVKWALGSITMNKASEGDGIPVELFQMLKDDAIKVLHSVCQQICKTQQWTQDWKMSVFIPIPKKVNAKECSHYRTIALILLTCLLRNLYAGQEATVRTGHGTTDWFQIGKGICQGCILHPDYLTYMQSISREMLGWRKHKLESRLPGEISITSDMQMTPPLWQKVKN